MNVSKVLYDVSAHSSIHLSAPLVAVVSECFGWKVMFAS